MGALISRHVSFVAGVERGGRQLFRFGLFPDQMTPSPLDRRFVFVTGKGGVGKTTVAASLARARSGLGQRVLLAVTDPEAYRELLPGARFEPDPSVYDARLHTVLIEPDAALREYGRLLIKPRLARQALFENRYVQGFLSALPGLPQWAVLGKAWYHTTEQLSGSPRFDVVIFDAPATGHAVEMLRLPRVITELARASILRRDAELAWNLLRDPVASAIVLVSLPEELPTNETLELDERIRELGLAVGVIVQNRMRPLLFGDAEREALARVPEVDAGVGAALDPRALALTAGPAAAAIEAAAAHAIRERAQLASRARLASVSPTVVELPELDGALPAAELASQLAGVLMRA
jgi:anion-transporting  ArsA/GET3 family ATPase